MRFITTIVTLAVSLLVALTSVNAASQPKNITLLPPKTIDLSGIWQFQPTTLSSPTPESSPADGAKWENIAVPDNWFRQGKDIHGQAWYRKHFDVQPEVIGRHVRLVFNGVDYAADVWINGHYLGHHEGYFQAFDFDVSGYLRQDKNELTVLVDSPLEKPEAWSFNKRLLKGIFSHHDTRPGGAWSARGQEQNTGGIWAPVRLEVSEKLAVRQLKVNSRLNAGTWKLEAIAAVDSDLGSDTEVTVEAIIEPENFKGPSYTFRQHHKLAHGESRLTLNLPVDNPRLWWPAGHGQPDLYRMKLRVTQAGRQLDLRETVFGFREVRVDNATQQWFINGRRLFLRGTNYISSQWLAEMTPARYRQDIKLMQDANINAIRVHAHIEAGDFYDICDRAGMLVMQDFLLQWGYADDEAFISEARRQAADMVNGLFNHPSVIAWVMHNEPPWDAPWMQTKYPDYNPQKNRVLDDMLYRDVSEMDASRVVRKESPTKEHEWIGWYFGQWQEFAKPTQNKWITEFGAQALPNLQSLKRIFNNNELWPDNEQEWEKWSFHNFQRHETFDIAAVPMGNNIQEFINNTQAYQAKLVQFAAESYRRQRYSPVAAIFQFMFVEDWPSINWGVVDYWRMPKPGYDALRIAYQPVLPSIEWIKESYTPGETATMGLWLINDLWSSFPQEKYKVTVLHNGKPVKNSARTVDIAPDSGLKLEDMKLEHLAEGKYEVKVEVVAADGRLLGHNQYHFTVTPLSNSNR